MQIFGIDNLVASSVSILWLREWIQHCFVKRGLYVDNMDFMVAAPHFAPQCILPTNACFEQLFHRKFAAINVTSDTVVMFY